MKHRCREVTRLVLEGEDRKLSLPERLAVRLHLLLCDACQRFVAQTQLMRRALQQWRADAVSATPPPDDAGRLLNRR